MIKKHRASRLADRAGLYVRERRIYDRHNNTLVYVACSRQIKDASAKMGLSTVSLYNTHPTWTAGKP